MSGKYSDSKSNMAKMNDMCDMSQFVVAIPVTDQFLNMQHETIGD